MSFLFSKKNILSITLVNNVIQISDVQLYNTSEYYPVCLPPKV